MERGGTIVKLRSILGLEGESESQLEMEQSGERWNKSRRQGAGKWKSRESGGSSPVSQGKEEDRVKNSGQEQSKRLAFLVILCSDREQKINVCHMQSDLSHENHF